MTLNSFLPFPLLPICFSISSRPVHRSLCTATAQTSLILRSIVLMTESILPFSTCLATLNVKPFTVWSGTCDGNGKHRVAAVATKSNRLPPWICQLCAESIGGGVGHGCPGERAEKSPIPAATDMSRRPYDSRSGVSEEKGVISSQIAERFGQEFRTYGLDPGTFINVVLQKTVEGVRFRDVLFEEAPIDFFLHPIEQRIKSGLDVANKTKINGGAAPNMLRVLVNLNFFHFVAGEEL